MAWEGIGFDWTVSIGNVLSVATVLGAFGWFLVSTRFRLETMERDLSQANGASSIRRDLDVIVVRVDTAIAGLTDRVNAISKRVDNINDDLRVHRLEDIRGKD